jgi:predicted nucleic acid-binding protein
MRSPTGASAALLNAARLDRVTLLVSVPLATEYEATCRQSRHRVGAGLTHAEVGIFLDAVIAMSEPIETYFLWRPQLHDPGDEMVLEAAINGGADGLVTFNIKDFGDAPRRFGIELLQPRQAMQRIRG